MALLTGIFPLRGSIGNVNFRAVKGDCIVGAKSTLDKDRIASGDEFKLTRQNNREFTGVAFAASAFRAAFSGVFDQYADLEFSQRIISVYHKVLRKDNVNPRGSRSVEVSLNRNLLKRIRNFDAKTPFDSAFRVRGQSIVVSAARDTATWTIPVANLANFIDPPKGATHLRFVLAIGLVSDYQYSATDSLYQPIDGDLDGLGEVGASAEIDPGQPMAAPVVVTASLPAGTLPTSTTTLIVAPGIEYYQLVSGQYVLMSDGNAMGIKGMY